MLGVQMGTQGRHMAAGVEGVLYIDSFVSGRRRIQPPLPRRGPTVEGQEANTPAILTPTEMGPLPPPASSPAC